MDKEIGRGNFGVVYKGTWRGGLVAIKQLIVKEGITEKEWEEFKSEAALMGSLRYVHYNGDCSVNGNGDSIL
jgi:serine/threonine protein kinase